MILSVSPRLFFVPHRRARALVVWAAARKSCECRVRRRGGKKYQSASSRACWRGPHDRSDRSPARASRTSRSPPAATRHFLPLATTWLTTHPVPGESAPRETVRGAAEEGRPWTAFAPRPTWLPAETCLIFMEPGPTVPHHGPCQYIIFLRMHGIESA